MFLCMTYQVLDVISQRSRLRLPQLVERGDGLGGRLEAGVTRPFPPLPVRWHNTFSGELFNTVSLGAAPQTDGLEWDKEISTFCNSFE